MQNITDMACTKNNAARRGILVCVTISYTEERKKEERERRDRKKRRKDRARKQTRINQNKSTTQNARETEDSGDGTFNNCFFRRRSCAWSSKISFTVTLVWMFLALHANWSVPLVSSTYFCALVTHAIIAVLVLPVGRNRQARGDGINTGVWREEGRMLLGCGGCYVPMRRFKYSGRDGMAACMLPARDGCKMRVSLLSRKGGCRPPLPLALSLRE